MQIRNLKVTPWLTETIGLNQEAADDKAYNLKDFEFRITKYYRISNWTHFRKSIIINWFNGRG